MGPMWDQLTDWAIRPTVATAAVAFALFAAALGPAERLWGNRSRSRPRRPGLGTDLPFWGFTPLVGKAATYAAGRAPGPTAADTPPVASPARYTPKRERVAAGITGGGGVPGDAGGEDESMPHACGIDSAGPADG